MYFKFLELVGFKSFAEKTVIGFEPGITAIIGPNGCGKSNVSDAIRWVLGEQNARRLRGSLMEDLIFGGTDQLEPMGMAEVSLTLGDTRVFTDDQYDEVTISRRLFRSGESQYFLNKRPCRLRDIHRLFMDTGLGTQAYSFVQQGNIELILSTKPEDRRYLFDETAGITKYKASKKEALRKLEYTEVNLARLDDRLREVKRQMISIQRQAGKARRYKELADELQRLEVGYSLHNRGRFAEQMKSLEKKREGVDGILRRLAQEIEERESRIREVRAELRSSELNHEELQSRKLDLLRNIDRESGNISLFEQRMADTDALSENVSAEIKKMRQKVAGLETTIRERKESLETLSEQKMSCEQRLKQKEERLNEQTGELRKSEAHSAELSNRLLELIRRETELRSRLSSIAETSGRNNQVLAELQQRREDVLQSLEQGEQARLAAERRNEALSQQLSRQKEDLAKLQENRKKTEEDLYNLRIELLEAESAISRAASEREFLAEALRRYEGYDAGVRAVIQESKSEGSELRGIIGTVADVIEVSPGHEGCVESALENRLQWVLTETVENAKRAAAYLREKARGRATFLPLDAIERSNGAREAVERFCEEKGRAFRPILDKVSFDQRCRKIAEYLLGEVVLAPDFDDAVTIAEQSERRLTFVTASGEKVEGGFAITAGNGSTAAVSPVTRKSRIASLAGEEETQRKRLHALRSREEMSLEAQKNLVVKIEQRTATISGMEDNASEANKKLLNLSVSIESLRNRGEELAERRSQTESDQGRLAEKERNLGDELKGVTEERAEVETAISSTRGTVERMQNEVASVKKDVAEVALAKASYDERIGNLQSDMEYMRGQLDLTKKELDSRARRIEEGKMYIADLRAEVQECHAAIVSLTQEKEGVTAAVEQLDDKRKLLVDELTQVEWEVKEKGNAARERERNKGELDVKLTEVRLSISRIDEYLMAEYALSYDDPNAAPLPEGSDLEEVQSRIAELKGRVQSLGPVNLFAIEEHDALKERYDFLMSQHSDISEAKNSLLKAIAKLDRESKALFREAFERIREEFREMFQRLFGGGRADLILVDESNILESGIEIIARPPGKKLQAISLLSGGERAMTAVSLLFAIFKVKPSPFCILDEIDAPLDESNVMRFAEVLKEFARNSQFVIITHNKRTIAASDVMYGITMEDSGKSKVVSARLTRRKEEASAQAAGASSQISREELVPASSGATSF